ncbi:MAG: 1-deoxy-D-xylulose-5-phosphate reductoisomerase, partial [Planctomycetes bacterium]|nr:1-deoxy-D-xylulose-5-phosphate reductoisomerase [Planctomycetota bacterium]
GLPSTLASAERGKRIALANKESLVMAGPILMDLVARNGAELMPVDSEHSAVWQCLRGESPCEVKRIILTASGGPFRTRDATTFDTITREEALRHPTWQMGPKITIDSATLMNKALEIIEARWLFDVEAERLDALIHPQSIVHSMVEFVDGSMMAQLGVTTMELPILLALGAPARTPASERNFLSLKDISSLTFEEIDRHRFPLFALGLEVAQVGKSAGAVFNAANEIAVAAFLDGAIAFTTIAEVVAEVLQRTDTRSCSSLEDLFEVDDEARRAAKALIAQS